jgi:LSD1 subclass zinc finger protein
MFQDRHNIDTCRYLIMYKREAQMVQGVLCSTVNVLPQHAGFGRQEPETYKVHPTTSCSSLLAFLLLYSRAVAKHSQETFEHLFARMGSQLVAIAGFAGSPQPAFTTPGGLCPYLYRSCQHGFCVWQIGAGARCVAAHILLHADSCRGFVSWFPTLHHYAAVVSCTRTRAIRGIFKYHHITLPRAPAIPWAQARARYSCCYIA